jgi:hypothetical protein
MVVSADQQPSAVSNHANGATGWELALVTAPSSNESGAAASKLVCFLLQRQISNKCI